MRLWLVDKADSPSSMPYHTTLDPSLHLELLGPVAEGNRHPPGSVDGRVSGADRVNVLLVDGPDLVPLLEGGVLRRALWVRHVDESWGAFFHNRSQPTWEITHLGDDELLEGLDEETTAHDALRVQVVQKDRSEDDHRLGIGYVRRL